MTLKELFSSIGGLIKSIGEWFLDGLQTLAYGNFLDLTIGQFIFTSFVVYSLYLLLKHIVWDDFIEDKKEGKGAEWLLWVGISFLIFVYVIRR
tara:strand:- start:896 stop:1174 length:279 start_codon:yes stop_codon:yes gene_type:complete